MGKKRKGRPPKFAKNPKTKLPVVGVSEDSNGYYYSFQRGERLPKRPHFGPPGDENFDDAFDKFQRYMIEHKGGKFDLIETNGFAPNPQSIHIGSGTQIIGWSDVAIKDTTSEPVLIQEVFDETTGERRYRIREDVKWKIVEDAIRQNPKLASEKTGIEELAYLKDIALPTPSLTLQKVGDMYCQRKYNQNGDPISHGTIRHAHYCPVIS